MYHTIPRQHINQYHQGQKAQLPQGSKSMKVEATSSVQSRDCIPRYGIKVQHHPSVAYFCTQVKLLEQHGKLQPKLIKLSVRQLRNPAESEAHDCTVQYTFKNIFRPRIGTKGVNMAAPCINTS